MNGLEGALCARLPVNEAAMFTETNAIDHFEAALICADCPAIRACHELAQSLYAASVDMRPVGTYAGVLYGGKGRPPGKPREHGTPRGYQQHRNRKETACFPCRDAERAAMDARLKNGAVCEHHDRADEAQWENVSGAGSTLTTSPGTSTRANPVRGSASRGL